MSVIVHEQPNAGQEAMDAVDIKQLHHPLQVGVIKPRTMEMPLVPATFVRPRRLLPGLHWALSIAG